MSGFYFCIICIVCVLAECFCVFVISAARSPCLYSGRTDSCVYYPDFISGKLIPFICYSAVRATLAALIHSQMICLVFEATSSIDTRTEALIEKGMDRLMEGRTVFVIAHRLSTVRNSNAIIVLEHGGIVERGSHDELLAQKGEYYQLYNGMFELA